jgi:hypothetical protein
VRPRTGCIRRAFLWRHHMGEMLSLDERLDAYLAVVEDEPDLTIGERLDLFALALWPKDEDIDYDHMMRCRDKFCRECAGTGSVAA